MALATAPVKSARESVAGALGRNPRLLHTEPEDALRVEHLLYELQEEQAIRVQVYEPLFGGCTPAGRASRVEATAYLPPFVEFVRLQLEQARPNRTVIFVRTLESLLAASPEGPAALAGLLEYLSDHAVTIVAPLRTTGPVAEAAPYLFAHPYAQPLRLPALHRDEVTALLRRLNHEPDPRLVGEAITLPYPSLVALAQTVPTERLLAAIADVKETLATERGLVEVDTSRLEAEVYGLDRLWDFWQEEVLVDLRAGRPLDTKGILLVGPPGNGKTQFANAAARALGKKLFKIRPQHSPYVGTSERRFRDALRTVEQAAPAVALIDEIDREFLGADSSADSGVTGRMLSEFLQWIERNESVFVVATSNAVQPLDFAVLRPGRLHPHFFVGPNPKTREELLRKGRNDFQLVLPDDEIARIAADARSFSGARIWEIVKRAARRGPDNASAFIQARVGAEHEAADREYRLYLPLLEKTELASIQLDP